jgi:hypothetical protein
MLTHTGCKITAVLYNGLVASMWLHFGGEMKRYLSMSFLRYVPKTIMMQARILVLHNEISIFEIHINLRIFISPFILIFIIQYDI